MTVNLGLSDCVSHHCFRIETHTAMSGRNSGSPSGQPCAIVRFRGADGEHAIPVSVPPVQATLVDLLAAARAISGPTTAIALERERAAGRAISCRAGCGACCRQLVAISVVEAESLARLVAAMPEEHAAVTRARFAAALKRLEEAGLLSPHEAPGDRALVGGETDDAGLARRNVGRRYFALKIACPFLENESCSIAFGRRSAGAARADLHRVPLDADLVALADARLVALVRGSRGTGCPAGGAD